MRTRRGSRAPLRVAGLFAGIGGVERGLHYSGHETVFLCEIDDAAQKVLKARFPGVPIEPDVCGIRKLPEVDLIAGGFPCQDLSQAGRTAGIKGSRSGLVGEVFRLVDKAQPRWLMLENVTFMLQLDRGEAMRYLAQQLTRRGYNWAYRVVDSRAFGLPQRRQRVILLASKVEDPRSVLLVDDVGHVPEPEPKLNGAACGFYWTEGVRGLGWAVDAVPTLKGGSTVGIPSPPAIVLPTGNIVTPDIRDAERLQGFPTDWTLPAVEGSKKRNGPRWKLVGNAVSVPVARWVGERLVDPKDYDGGSDSVLQRDERWPRAAWCMGGEVHIAEISAWPKRLKRTPLAEFLKYSPLPLSARATAGFQQRAAKGNLRFPEGFLDAVSAHLLLMQGSMSIAKQLTLPIEASPPA